MSNKEILGQLIARYGKKVACTNGLFHIYDDLHNELYINPIDGIIDKRAKYRTIVVLEEIVVAEILTSKTFKYVILRKSDLSIIYKTRGVIEYIDNNIMKCTDGEDTMIISQHGKILTSIENVEKIKHLYGNNYLVNCSKMFSDKIVYYDRLRDTIVELTEDRNYSIFQTAEGEPEIEVTSMQGGKYLYNFETRVCFNCFTNREEKQTYLWRIY